MINPDIRWKQRLANYKAALSQLRGAVELSTQRSLSELEKQGLIQAFEFTHELAWNVMRDYFKFQGSGELLAGPRDAIREAFQKGLITQGEVWMEMIKSRNQTSHTYNQSVAEEIVKQVVASYLSAMNEFETTMGELASK